MLAAHGVRVEQVAEPHPDGGWQAPLPIGWPNCWPMILQPEPDQYNNPSNVDAYRELAVELYTQLGQIGAGVFSGKPADTRQGGPGVAGIPSRAWNWSESTRSGRRFSGQPARTAAGCAAGPEYLSSNVDYPAFNGYPLRFAPAETRMGGPGPGRDAPRATGGGSVGAVALVAGWAAPAPCRGRRSRRSSPTARSATSTASQ